MPCRPDQLEPGSRRPTIRIGTEAIATPTRPRAVAVSAVEMVPATEPASPTPAAAAATPVMRVRHLRVRVKHMNDTPRAGVRQME